MSNIIKCSDIRSNSDNICPFGLSISHGCYIVGELIDKMGPLAILGPNPSLDEISEIINANNFLLRWNHPNKKCKYAAALFDKNHDIVECSWNTDTAGISDTGAIVGSPYYYKNFSGIGTDGLYSYPLGYYADNSIDRGLYYGMYSLESIAKKV